MRWPMFAIIGFVAVAVQLSVRNALTLHSLWGISPNVVAPVAVFIALFSPRLTALWGCWLLGLALDLAPQAGPNHLLGIFALAFTAGGYAILQLRTMVFRRRALTVGFLTFVFLLAASLVAVTLLTIRSWYPGGEGYWPLSDFAVRLLSALYSGVIAIPIGWALSASSPLWGFQSRAAGR